MNINFFLNGYLYSLIFLKITVSVDPMDFSLIFLTCCLLTEPCSGKVEYYHPNFGWGAICEPGFGAAETMAICNQLGWTTYYSTYCCYRHSGTFVFSNLGCKGSETDLANCPNVLNPALTTCMSSYCTTNGYNQIMGPCPSAAGVSCGDNMRI